jgi:hypothetical protein
MNTKKHKNFLLFSLPGSMFGMNDVHLHPHHLPQALGVVKQSIFSMGD